MSVNFNLILNLSSDRMVNRESQNIEEKDLWISFIQGNDESLEILYRRYFDELYSYGKKWLGDALLTEDSIQDLFIKLMRSRSSLSATTSVKYYLFRSFRSVVLDKLRTGSRMQLIDEPGEHLFSFGLCPEKILIAEQESLELKTRLEKAMQLLTPRQREAIFLRYIEGFSYAEVAEAMELTTKGIYKLMARAIEALKNNMLAAQIFVLIRLTEIFF